MKLSYRKYNDSELLLKIAGKKSESEKAFKVLHQRYMQNVFAYIKTLIRDHDESEDLFQEVFIRFYNNAKKGIEISNVQSYLIKIARNLCLNHKRDKKHQVEVEDWHRTVDDELNLEHKEMFNLVMRALEIIDEKYSEAFVLKKIEGFKFTEVAEILEITVEGAKTRVNRARQKLLTILDPYINDTVKRERIN